MKLILLIILCSILSIVQMYSGDLFVKGSYGFNFHLTQEAQSNPYIPSEFQVEVQTVGLGQFYNNSNGYNYGIGFLSSEVNNSNLHLLLTLNYESHYIFSTSKSVDYIFGNKLSFSSICFTFGLGTQLKNSEMSSFVFLNCGPLLNYTKGSTNLINSDISFEYEPSLFFRLSLNSDIPIITPNQGINMCISYDVGDVNRGKVNYYQNGNWIARAKPTGDQNIVDNRINLAVGIFWKIL